MASWEDLSKILPDLSKKEVKEKVAIHDQEIISLRSEIASIKLSLSALQSESQKNESLKNELINYQNQVRELTQRNANLESNNDDLEEKIEDLKSQIENYKQNIDELQFAKSELLSKSENLENELLEKKSNIEDLYNQNSQKQAKIDSLEQNLSESKEESARLYRKVDELESNNSDLEQNLANSKNQNESLEARINQISSDNERLQSDLLSTENSFSQYKQDYESSVQKYKILLESMLKCTSLNGYFDAFGIDKNKGAEDFKNMVSLVNLIGHKYTFATFLVDVYQRNSSVLDENDFEFIEVLNDFYKDRFSIDADILIAKLESDRFDKNIMRDKDDDKKICTSFSEIYAPGVRKPDGVTIERMMVVKGERN